MPIPRLALIAPLIAPVILVAGVARAEPAAAPADPVLSITFSGIEAKPGPILVGIFDEAGWSGETPLRGEMLYPKGSEVHAAIADLPPGRYGIKAFHDLNGNGKLDRNAFGIPTEPFAFSNNARASGGPAKWADASFALAPGTTAQTITIR